MTFALLSACSKPSLYVPFCPGSLKRNRHANMDVAVSEARHHDIKQEPGTATADIAASNDLKMANVMPADGAAATSAFNDSEPALKHIKLQDGSASPVRQPEAQSPQPAAVDEFVLSDDLGAIILNFLVRMAFLIGEGSEKDPELMALHGHTLGLLDLALELFPHVPVKLGLYLDRLLQVNHVVVVVVVVGGRGGGGSVSK